MTVISDYRSVPAVKDAKLPEDLEKILADTQCHRLDVVIALTDVSDVIAFEHPHDGMAISEAAIRLAGELPKQGREAWCLAHFRGMSTFGSRLRAAGGLEAADAFFSASRKLLHDAAGEHWLEQGDLCRRIGFLRIDQRKHKEALDFAEASKNFFELGNHPHGIGCALVCRGNVHLKAKRYQQAASDYRSSIRLLDLDLGFNHVWGACLNLAHALIDGKCSDEELDDALQELKAVHALSPYDRYSVPSVFLCWLEARLLMKLSQWSRAKSKLQGVQSACQQLSLPYPLTMVSLDLAACYHAQGMRAEAARLARDMFPLLHRFRQDERAYRALTDFYRSAVEQALTVTIIASTRKAVEQTQCCGGV